MTNQAKFLLSIALTAAWPCAAEEIHMKWWLQQDGVVIRATGRAERISLPDWTVAGERHSCPPAAAVGPRGEILVTSNVLSSVWKVDPQTLKVTVHPLELDSDGDKDVGFSTLRYSAEEGAWLAFSAMHGSTWRIDPGLTRAKKIAYNPEWRKSCAIN